MNKHALFDQADSLIMSDFTQKHRHDTANRKETDSGSVELCLLRSALVLLMQIYRHTLDTHI